EVRGGVVPWQGGDAQWIPSHRVRMGMARAVGDFDRDGRTEVAIGRLYGEDANTDGDLRVIQEDGTVEMVPTLRGVRAVGAGDLDGDGKAELLFGDGWHKNYGKLARYRPNVATRAANGTWAVTTLDERTDNYAIEQIGIVGRTVVAGGNATLGVYEFGGKGWRMLEPRHSVRGTGGFAALPGGALLLSGERVSRIQPGASVDVPLHEQKQPKSQE
ncbi:MAG: VCBS repeat-containing protein, partial [Deltaproteobacteria bacterium]|nr:VCBS repeat-containing protein [Deltaproteobacteria bacterium]